MDDRPGGKRFWMNFDAWNARALNAAWPYFGRLDRRGRLSAAVAISVVVHLALIWMLLSERPDAWHLSQSWQTDDQPEPVELWRVTLPRPEPRPKVIPQMPERPEVPPRDVTQPQPAPAAQSAPSQAVQRPQPAPEVTVPVPQVNPLPSPVATPQVEAPREMSLSLKTKKKDNEKVARDDNALGKLSDLKLHQVPSINLPALNAVQPSGLTRPTVNPGGSSAGGEPAVGSRLGTVQLPGGLSGMGVNGRGAVSQALQDHDYCVDQQIKGKAIPADCHMSKLSEARSLGVKHVAEYDKVLAKRQSQATPGNDDYWRRVVQGPTDPGHDDHMPHKGAYSEGRANRVKGECSLSDSC
ncbi:hypothetical protein [Asticcacaulis sp. EMRT-3]|uniref:hypothetical protein n=1 Tax=Asticcacaulis sp. EMRT-3 TaxID=3040349 RepID=UPI0024AEBDA8|nr:hypothetical protein [Asticcacaulis sp. EMRT-3]MDI7774429.1 hypothetical protein [Asticcacaulis sp. EMRT-3]